VVIQVLDGVFTDIGDIPSDFFRTQAGITRLDLIFFNVDRGKGIILDKALGNQDSISKFPPPRR
jgi:hypothetical protein